MVIVMVIWVMYVKSYGKREKNSTEQTQAVKMLGLEAKCSSGVEERKEGQGKKGREDTQKAKWSYKAEGEKKLRKKKKSSLKEDSR